MARSCDTSSLPGLVALICDPTASQAERAAAIQAALPRLETSDAQSVLKALARGLGRNNVSYAKAWRPHSAELLAKLNDFLDEPELQLSVMQCLQNMLGGAHRQFIPDGDLGAIMDHLLQIAEGGAGSPGSQEAIKCVGWFFAFRKPNDNLKSILNRSQRRFAKAFAMVMPEQPSDEGSETLAAFVNAVSQVPALAEVDGFSALVQQCAMYLTTRATTRQVRASAKALVLLVGPNGLLNGDELVALAPRCPDIVKAAAYHLRACAKQMKKFDYSWATAKAAPGRNGKEYFDVSKTIVYLMSELYKHHQLADELAGHANELAEAVARPLKGGWNGSDCARLLGLMIAAGGDSATSAARHAKLAVHAICEALTFVVTPSDGKSTSDSYRPVSSLARMAESGRPEVIAALQEYAAKLVPRLVAILVQRKRQIDTKQQQDTSGLKSRHAVEAVSALSVIVGIGGFVTLFPLGAEEQLMPMLHSAASKEMFEGNSDEVQAAQSQASDAIKTLEESGFTVFTERAVYCPPSVAT